MSSPKKGAVGGQQDACRVLGTSSLKEGACDTTPESQNEARIDARF
jgi:hypothetical protein